MQTLPYKKPRLASHYYVRFEPPDERGDEVLHFISETRRIKLKGHAFREFRRYVVPLLDGAHTADDITAAVADVFVPADVEAGLALLAEHRLLEEGDRPAPDSRTVSTLPQSNLFHDVGADPRVVNERLREASVAIVGVGGVGAAAATALAAAGIGGLRLVDVDPVATADPYLAPLCFASDAVGQRRSSVLQNRLAAIAAGDVRVTTAPLDDDESVRGVLTGSSFVVCALDAGRSSLAYKVNRVCLAEKIPLLAVSSAAFEVVVGPLVRAHETACLLCYKMRLVACAEEPEEEFAFQHLLDRRQHDDSGNRENLVCGTAIAGNLAALEVIKMTSGVVAPSTAGAVVVIDLLTLSSTRHVVLRKPWCAACGAPSVAAPQGDPR